MSLYQSTIGKLNPGCLYTALYMITLGATLGGSVIFGDTIRSWFTPSIYDTSVKEKGICREKRGLRDELQRQSGDCALAAVDYVPFGSSTDSEAYWGGCRRLGLKGHTIGHEGELTALGPRRETDLSAREGYGQTGTGPPMGEEGIPIRGCGINKATADQFAELLRSYRRDGTACDTSALDEWDALTATELEFKILFDCDEFTKK